VLSYVHWLTERKMAPATIARRLAALRSVVKLARTLGHVSWSIDIASPRIEPYRDTRGPGPDGWRKIRETTRAKALLGSDQAVRDFAIVSTLRGLGLRRAELVGVDLADVELDPLDPAVWIVGKGKVDRERRTMPPSVTESLRAWIAIRGDWPGPLFVRLDRCAVSRGGLEGRARLTDRSVGNIVPAVGHRAGLVRRVRPHGLRHEAITAALDATGGDVRRVQKFSRHSRVETLLRYDDRRKDDAGEIARLIDEE
jgi:integrase/recombinase XerC